MLNLLHQVFKDLRVFFHYKDGRILISQTWSGEVAEISRGGDISKYEPFASGLSTPYSLACTYRQDGSERITISDRFG